MTNSEPYYKYVRGQGWLCGYWQDQPMSLEDFDLMVYKRVMRAMQMNVVVPCTIRTVTVTGTVVV